MSLTYVTLRTDDGVLKIPNSAMLAAGVGHLSPAASAPGSPTADRPGTAAAGAAPQSVAQGGAPSGQQPGL